MRRVIFDVQEISLTKPINHFLDFESAYEIGRHPCSSWSSKVHISHETN